MNSAPVADLHLEIFTAPLRLFNHACGLCNCFRRLLIDELSADADERVLQEFLFKYVSLYTLL